MGGVTGVMLLAYIDTGPLGVGCRPVGGWLLRGHAVGLLVGGGTGGWCCSGVMPSACWWVVVLGVMPLACRWVVLLRDHAVRACRWVVVLGHAIGLLVGGVTGGHAVGL